jgi:hypothetical protein
VRTILCVSLCLLSCNLIAFSQSKKQTTQQHAPVVSAQKQIPPSIQKPEPASLSIEAGLVFQSSDFKPVARTAFMLLDDDLATILIGAGIKLPKGMSDSGRGTEWEFVHSYGFAPELTALPEWDEFLKNAQAAIAPHIVKTATTDFDGKAEFDSLPQKTLYLVGTYKTPLSFAVWNLKIEKLNPGKNSIVLDQKNAVYAK